MKKPLRITLIVAGAIVAIGIIGSITSKGNDKPSGPSPVAAQSGTTQPPAPAASTGTPAPKPAGPADGFGAGIHKVGEDIKPGRYKTPGPDKGATVPMCYYARLKNDSGDFNAIISNGNLQGPGSVTVKPGEFVQATGDCTWTLAG